MRTLLCTLALACVLTGCAASLDRTPAPTFDTSLYPGAVAPRVGELNQLMWGCAAQRDAAADRWDRRARHLWYWNFLTAALGLTSTTVAGILQLNDNSEEAGVTAAVTNLAITLSLGIRSASGLERRLNEQKRTYDAYENPIVHVRSAFPALQPDLANNDPAAREQLGALMQMVRTVCPGATP